MLVACETGIALVRCGQDFNMDALADAWRAAWGVVSGTREADAPPALSLPEAIAESKLQTDVWQVLRGNRIPYMHRLQQKNSRRRHKVSIIESNRIESTVWLLPRSGRLMRRAAIGAVRVRVVSCRVVSCRQVPRHASVQHFQR